MARDKGIYIDRSTIVDKINQIGREQWEAFSAQGLIPAGDGHRCEMLADGKRAILDFIFRADGTTFIRVCGNNTEISSLIKERLEEQCLYNGKAEHKTCSIKKIPKEWSDKLIHYISELDRVTVLETFVETQPRHTEYICRSALGDKLVINRYENGTLVLQGKLAYIFSETISFLSYCTEITVDDIVETVNAIHHVNVKINDVHEELKVLLKNSYSKINPVILKILSPSIALKKVGIELEDYSCYAFPALRALEGYIKYLLGLKDITVGHSFGNIFRDIH